MTGATASHSAGDDNFVYVYGVADGDALCLKHVPPLRGIVPDVPVELLPVGNLALVVTRAAREVFAVPEASGEAARDMATDRALAHHRVLSELTALCTVAPVKYGALCRGMDDVLTLLERHGDAFAHALARISGAQEWGIRLFVDGAACRAVAEAAPAVAVLQEELASTSPGKAFFLRKKLRAAVDDEMRAAFARLSDEVHQHIVVHAREAAPNPAHRLLNATGDGQAPVLVLDAAYLVYRTCVAGFHQAVADCAKAAAAQGGLLKLTGPWPPYSFVSVNTAEVGHEGR
jgi:hypothetical protein